jgi:putative endonuclease
VRTPDPDIGQLGEDAASRWLEARGWTVIARRERVAGVEVDIIAADPDASALVVVEVKSRRAPRGGRGESVRPEESVNRAKLARLTRAACALEPRARRMGLSVRVDAIAVRICSDGPAAARIDHFPDATA